MGIRNRVMVDMSATLLHHGHVILLKKASRLGQVIVGLTRDADVKRVKGYSPELRFAHRKEILLSIRYVDEVVPTPWTITNRVLEKHDIDFLVHGDDNQNDVPAHKLKVFRRTDGVSTSILRSRVLENIAAINLHSADSAASTELAKRLISTIHDKFKLD